MKSLNEMTLREKICQLFVVKANPELHIKEFGSIKNFMEKYPVGAIFAGTEIIRDDVFTAEKIQEAVMEYQAASEIPLLVAGDCESGCGGVLKGLNVLPPELSLAGADSEELAYQFGKVTAQEARMIGFNWTYSPVCDLMLNPFGALVGTRGLGDNPETAKRLIAQIVKGLEENGLVSTGKHFPGDGLDARNQHIVGSYNTLPYDEWREKSGAVFKAAIDAGMNAIMAGHISLPSYQTDDVNGVYPPATISYDLITKLLKEELGFEGIVVTDALDMGGFVRWYEDRNACEVLSIKNGCDMLLWPKLGTLERIEKAVNEGFIPMSRIDDAVSRILKVKERIATFGYEPTGIDQKALEENRKVATAIAQKSACLVHNKLSLIPLDKNKYKKVRIIEINNDNAHRSTTDALQEAFEERGATVEVTRSWNNFTLDPEKINRNYDLIVYANYCVSAVPMRLYNIVNLHSAQTFDREKTVVITLGTPHYLTEYYTTAETAVHTYEHKECARNTVAALYGEIPFAGKLPFDIEKPAALKCHY